MAAEAKSSGGGVRNLRAMFENKDESSTSPPDRGRSPVGSIGMLSKGLSKHLRRLAPNTCSRLTMPMQAEEAMARHHGLSRRCEQALLPSKGADSSELSLV